MKADKTSAGSLNFPERKEGDLKKLKRIVTLLMAAGMVGPFAAHLAAQNRSAVADIPFSFVVSGRTLPAGQYTISQTFQGGAVFTISNGHDPSSAVMLASLERDKDEKQVVSFVCEDKVCALAKVSVADSNTVYSLTPSALAKVLPRTLGMASMVSVKLARR